jgi:hypothetical protein|tara:strand:+ start:31 stop:318 length:288 start_codon:yes stop_codon:yes gene_type:complete
MQTYEQALEAERLSEKKNSSTEDTPIIKELEAVGKYLLFDAHRLEAKQKGGYETRRRLERAEDGLWNIQGSGKCNEMAKKIYNCIRRLNNVSDFN